MKITPPIAGHFGKIEATGRLHPIPEATNSVELP
jgi:hypothetical protein